MRVSRFALLFCSFVMIACGKGQTTEPPDANVKPPDAKPIVCGDGECATVEVGNCVPDCGGNVCVEDGRCDPGEMGLTPPCLDCPTNTGCNNNGTCEPGNGEDMTNCPADCPAQGTCNGNGTCEAGEDMMTCEDCGGGPLCTKNSDCAAPLCCQIAICGEGTIIIGDICF